MGEFVCGRIHRNSSGMGVSTSEGNGILHTDESGAEYLQYVEDVSKSNNGGLVHLRIRLLGHMKMLRKQSAVL